jgi:hypothetical protein
MKLRFSLCAFAALFLWANVSQACVSEPQVTFSFDPEDTLVQIASETASLPEPAPENRPEADAPISVLLIDHEGEPLPFARELVLVSAPGLFASSTEVMSAEDEAWVLAAADELGASIASYIAEAGIIGGMAIDGFEDR